MHSTSGLAIRVNFLFWLIGQPSRLYHIAGFVCKALFGMNYARHHGLANFNSIVTFMPSFQLNNCFACVTVMCLVICLTYVSLQVLQRLYISLFLFHYPTRDLQRRPSFCQLWCSMMPVQKALLCIFITAVVQHLKLCSCQTSL